MVEMVGTGGVWVLESLPCRTCEVNGNSHGWGENMPEKGFVSSIDLVAGHYPAKRDGKGGRK